MIVLGPAVRQTHQCPAVTAPSTADLPRTRPTSRATMPKRLSAHENAGTMRSRKGSFGSSKTGKKGGGAEPSAMAHRKNLGKAEAAKVRLCQGMGRRCLAHLSHAVSTVALACSVHSCSRVQCPPPLSAAVSTQLSAQLLGWCGVLSVATAPSLFTPLACASCRCARPDA